MTHTGALMRKPETSTKWSLLVTVEGFGRRQHTVCAESKAMAREKVKKAYPGKGVGFLKVRAAL